MDQHESSAVEDLTRLFENDDSRIARHRAITELRSMMRQRLRNGDAVDEVCAAYEDGRSAYESLLLATNERSWDAEKLEPWRHQNFIPSLKGKKRLEPYILVQEIENAIAEYLQGRVRTNQLDRAFLDAGIAAELFGYMDHPSAQMTTFSILGYLGNLALAAILLWVSDQAWWANAITVLLVTAPFWVPLVSRHIRATRKRLRAMIDAYLALDGAVSSVREVRRALEAARDLGAVWPNSLWVLLEDIEARRTSV